MDRNTIVNKVLEEYNKYGVKEFEVNALINIAKACDTPEESIYPGIKMILNQQFGIDDGGCALNDSMTALVNYAVAKSKAQY